MGAKANLGKAVLNHWKLIGGVTLWGHAELNDQSVLDSAADGMFAMLNIKQREDETRLGAITRTVVDTATKPGTTDDMINKISRKADEVFDSVSQIAGTTRQLASQGESGMKDFFSGMSGGLGGGLSNLFSSLTSGISSLFGGGSSGLNFGALAMLPLAWFTFGKFGWLGKVGALAMLMYGVSNLFNRQQPAVQQVRSDGYSDGNRNLRAGDAYDKLEKEQERQAAGNGEDYNVRAKV